MEKEEMVIMTLKLKFFNDFEVNFFYVNVIGTLNITSSGMGFYNYPYFSHFSMNI